MKTAIRIVLLMLVLAGPAGAEAGMFLIDRVSYHPSVTSSRT